MLFFTDSSWVLVPGSSRVKDALGDTIPPAPAVLRSLFNLVPADAHFPDILLDDIFPVLSRSTWPPPPETLDLSTLLSVGQGYCQCHTGTDSIILL